MRYLIFIFFILINVESIHSQNYNYQIVTKDNKSFIYKDIDYNFKDLDHILKLNQSAFSNYKKARINSVVSKITALLGGGLIGYSTIRLIKDYKKTDFLFMASGASLIGVSYIFYVRKNKKIKQSLSIFNK